MENIFAGADKPSASNKPNAESVLHKLIDDALPLNSLCKTIIEESVKSAPLFITGSKGLALTLVTHVLAEVKTNNSTDRQMADGLAGIAKGLLVRKGFEAFGRLSPALELLPTKYELALRGAGLGIVSRFAETAGSLDTWHNKAGKLDLAQGTKLTGATVLSPVSIGCDIASFGLAKGMHAGLNAATKGLVDRNAMLSMSIMGSAFGINGGAIGEYTRQLKDNENLDWHKIGNSAFIGGASGGLSSLPGGYQLHLRAQNILKSMDCETINPTSQKPMENKQWQFMNMKPSLRYADIIEPTDIAHMELPTPRWQPLRDLHKRLEYNSKTTEEIPVWKPLDPSVAPGPNNGSASMEPCAFRKYSIEGHATQIFVPGQYADKLYSVRAGRIKEQSLWRNGKKSIGKELEDKVIENLASKKYFDSDIYRQYRFRLLPEHLIRALDELPNSNLVKRILLLEHPLAYDFEKSTDHVTRADADLRHGEIRLFGLRDDNFFPRTMRHEWSHFLEGSSPNRHRAFEKALAIENGLCETAANPRDYGRHSKTENWAVIGETLLLPSAKTFIEWLNKAPNRSCAFSLALGDSLVQNPAETSIYKNQYENRVNFVKTELVPRLQKQILEELQKINAEAEQLATSQRLGLLAEISGADYVKQIGPLLKTTKSPTMIREIVIAGLERLLEHPEKRVDFLLALPRNAYMNEALADAVLDLPAETFTNHYLPKLKELELKSGTNNWRFKNAYALFDLRCWNDCRFNNFLPTESVLYWLDRAKPTELHYFHEVALKDLEAKASKATQEQQITTALNLYERILPLKQKLGQTEQLESIVAKIRELRKATGN